MSITPSTTPLPCNRGIPNNHLNRAYHRFEANEHGVAVCIYCGEKPAGKSLGERLRSR